MKTRIIGTFLILLILFGLYVTTSHEPAEINTPTPLFNNDSSFKSLSIN